jgi:hypothetical protein
MSSTAAHPLRNLWPYAIVAWFVIFGAAMAAWITVAVRQDMDLVRPDYYEEEVRFQRQLDRANRTAAIQNQVALYYDATKREVALRLPAAHLSPKPTGASTFTALPTLRSTSRFPWPSMPWDFNASARTRFAAVFGKCASNGAQRDWITSLSK